MDYRLARRIRYAAILLATLMTAACDGVLSRKPHPDPGVAPPGAILSASQALAITNRYVASEGIDPGAYSPGEPHFELVKPDHTWAIVYDGRDNVLGNHFMVIFDERTRKIRLVPGV